MFTIKLYSFPEILRKRVQDLVEDTTQFLNGKAVHILREKVISHIQTDSLRAEIEAMFNRLQNPFLQLETEYLRLKHFRTGGNIIEPVQHKIGEREEFREKK